MQRALICRSRPPRAFVLFATSCSLLSGLRHRSFPTTALCAAAVFVCIAPAAFAAPRSALRASEGSCRQAANGLISLIDAKTDNTQLYRDTYAVVVNSCGPPSSPPKASEPPPKEPQSRDACHDLAAALVDLIEDGEMNTKAFVKARGDFALACAPL